jgi:hypothetical protein
LFWRLAALLCPCNNGNGEMGVPGGDVHLPVVWERRPRSRSSFGRGPGFFAAVLEERSDGRSGAKKGGRISHGEGL